MKKGILFGAAVLAASTWSASALAGRADDTMNWATDREVAIIDCCIPRSFVTDFSVYS